jgi:hypothetical protein
MWSRGVFTFLGVLLIAGSGWAVDPADKCEADKLKEAGKYGFCRLKAESKAVKKSEPADYTKCDANIDKRWPLIESKAAGACPTSGDQAAAEAEMIDCVDRMVQALDDPNYSPPDCGNGMVDPNEQCDFGDLGGETCETQGFAYGTLACSAGCVFDTSGCTSTRFVDPNDGTIIDNETGLTWEKKTDDASVHDVDNTYTWTDGGDADFADPDGTAFTEFLGELNNCESADGTTITGGFAGHCDWRVPTIVELQAILLELYPPACGTDPCIDPIFGPTASSLYWSSTTHAINPFLAWGVQFNIGFVSYESKGQYHRVRAVRGP